VRYGYEPSFIAYAVAMSAAMALYYFYFRHIPEIAHTAAAESLVRAPEPVSEAEAPESLPLRPGRGEPIIIISGHIGRDAARQTPGDDPATVAAEQRTDGSPARKRDGK
jgi:hypothetical protein